MQHAPHATYTVPVGIDCGPYLKHSYADLIGSRSPLLLELVGRFELVGSAPIVPTAWLQNTKVRLTLTAQFELRITVGWCPHLVEKGIGYIGHPQTGSSLAKKCNAAPFC